MVKKDTPAMQKSFEVMTENNLSYKDLLAKR